MQRAFSSGSLARRYRGCLPACKRPAPRSGYPLGMVGAQHPAPAVLGRCAAPLHIRGKTRANKRHPARESVEAHGPGRSTRSLAVCLPLGIVGAHGRAPLHIRGKTRAHAPHPARESVEAHDPGDHYGVWPSASPSARHVTIRDIPGCATPLGTVGAKHRAVPMLRPHNVRGARCARGAPHVRLFAPLQCKARIRCRGGRRTQRREDLP